ncbi:MAG: flagellar hook-associated protein FlgK [Planctomycetes bacterium]|nr:flagellar hook-associated protein FlgK [Planctomycetota bacterium]
MSSIFTSLKVAGSALHAASAAVRTVGHNIANGGNEDYNRQRVNLVANQPDVLGNLQIGNGVELKRIERILDQRVETLLRDARSAFSMLHAKDRALERLEQIFNELDGTGLSSAISKFFDAAADLANNPADIPTRQVFISTAQTLAGVFRSQDREIHDFRKDLNFQVEETVNRVNELTRSIADLNEKILGVEKGGVAIGTANDLRDQRDALTKQLADLVDIKVVETSTGVYNISHGSEFLVEGQTAQTLELDTGAEEGVPISEVRFSGSGRIYSGNGGALKGLLEARDTIAVKYLDEINALASGIILEVNKVHTGGEGLIGWSDLRSSEAVESINAALNEAGLPFTPRTGSFDLRVRDTVTGLVKNYNLRVDLDGLNGDDTSLQDLADSIDAQAGADFPELEASITLDNRLRIRSSSDRITFSFANDNSYVLSGLGVAGFFTGSDATDIAVSSDITGDPRLVAAGQGDGPLDPRNILAISALRNTPLLGDDSQTFEEFYQRTVGLLGIERRETKNRLENQGVIKEHLENERAAISGVNVDEESIELIKYQRMFQGAARYLSVVDTMLDSLLDII